MSHRFLSVILASVMVTAVVVAAAVAVRSASAADNPYQRGPDPTVASIAATNGTFATAQTTVPAGNGFNGGYIYYPTDTSQTYGAVAIVPGYTAKFANEEAWMGPRLASFGFVVIGIETNSTTDFDTARGTQLLAALDYLTRQSPVSGRIDPNRLGVIGHSMGGGGALYAATQRPSLKAAVGLAPYFPSGNLANDRVPTMIIGGQNDTVVTPSYLAGLYPALPGATPGAYVQLSGADHLFFTKANNIEMRSLIPWLKVFIDNDTRYTQFLCPTLKDTTGVSSYSGRCSLIPSGGPTSAATTATTLPPATTATTLPPTTTTATRPPATTGQPPAAACSATYSTVNSWPGGFQGQVIVKAGNAAINGWTITWTLASGQSITQMWGGTPALTGTSVSVKSVAWNGSLAAGGTATVGFIGAGNPSTPTVACDSP